MPEKFSRIAIVTGASSGIGEATVRRFTAAGFGVVGNGRNTGELARLENDIGRALCTVAGDAADEEVLERLFLKAREYFGRDADIVVANAGKGLSGSVTQVDMSRVGELIDINLKGALALVQKAARRMADIQQKAYPGSAADIVIIGSVVGRHLSPFSAVYSATKFAVHSLAESLRREMGPKGVRVSLVEPGIVLSGFQETAGFNEEAVKGFQEKFGQLLTGADIAAAIHYIVSQPPHIHISDIVVRPTGQDYP